MKIFNYECVVNSVKGFGKVYESHDHCMRLLLVNRSMDEVKKSDEIVRDGSALKATTVSRVKEWLDNG